MSIIAQFHPDMTFDEVPDHEFYPTPVEFCEKALDLVLNKDARFPISVLDPGAGAGSWGVALRNWYLKRRVPYTMKVKELIGVEIREDAKSPLVPLPASVRETFDERTMSFIPIGGHEGLVDFPYTEWIKHDFLDPHFVSTDTVDSLDLVMGNPPFSLAVPFIKQSMKMLRPGGQLLFLLPSTFLGTQDRGQWLWYTQPPKDIYFVLERISFKAGKNRKTGKPRKGGTDQKEYVLVRWVKGYDGPTLAYPFSWKDALKIRDLKLSRKPKKKTI